jgi:hypothetical protein
MRKLGSVLFPFPCVDIIERMKVIPQLEAAKECHCDPAFRGTDGLAMTNLDPRN